MLILRKVQTICRTWSTNTCQKIRNFGRINFVSGILKGFQKLCRSTCVFNRLVSQYLWVCNSEEQQQKILLHFALNSSSVFLDSHQSWNMGLTPVHLRAVSEHYKKLQAHCLTLLSLNFTFFFSKTARLVGLNSETSIPAFYNS